MNELLSIDPDVLGLAIRGRNLRGATLGEELGDDTTVLAFLRHFG